MGLVILYDIFHRVQVADLFYSDSGVLSRDYFLKYMAHPWSFSLLFFNGTLTFSYLYFFVYFLITCFFIIGFKTKFITIMLWIFTVSLHDRNWWVLNAGDDILRIYLLICIFLPMGAIWSVDSLKENREKIINYSSLWSFAFYFQIAIIYFSTFFYKDSPEWRSDFSATEYALGLDTFLSYFGSFFREASTILQGLTLYSIIGEIVCPVLLMLGFIFYSYAFIPKILAIIFGLSFHCGLIVMMTLGDFPFFCVAYWLGLLPNEFWAKMFKKYPKLVFKQGFFRRFSFLNFFEFKIHLSKKVTKCLKWASNLTALIFLFSIVQWNLAEFYPKKFEKLEYLRWPARTLHTFQKWSMFAPFPYSHNEWLSMPSVFEDGETRDVMDYGYKGTDSRPDFKVVNGVNSLTKKFLSVIFEDKEALEQFAFYNCRRFNKDKNRMKSFSIIRYRQAVTLKDMDIAPVDKENAWNHDCY